MKLDAWEMATQSLIYAACLVCIFGSVIIAVERAIAELRKRRRQRRGRWRRLI